jgi:hypothetical protein
MSEKNTTIQMDLIKVKCNKRAGKTLRIMYDPPQSLQDTQTLLQELKISFLVRVHLKNKCMRVTYFDFDTAYYKERHAIFHL